MFFLFACRSGQLNIPLYPYISTVLSNFPFHRFLPEFTLHGIKYVDITPILYVRDEHLSTWLQKEKVKNLQDCGCNLKATSKIADLLCKE